MGLFSGEDFAPGCSRTITDTIAKTAAVIATIATIASLALRTAPR